MSAQKNKYSKEVLDKARLMYLNYAPLREIEESCKIDINSIKYHIKTSWKTERTIKQNDLLETLTEDKRKDLVEITHYGLSYLNKALKELAQNPSELNPHTMKVVSDIVFKINHIHSLDQGKPTSISAEIKPATVIEIQELLKKDPFHTPIEEIDYKEINPFNKNNQEKEIPKEDKE